MKKYNNSRFVPLLLSSAIFSVNLLSQASNPLSQEFLAGLPPEVAEELLLNNAVKKEEDLEKLFRADTKFIKSKDILEKIRYELKSIEKRIDVADGRSSDSLERFGESFFSTIQSSFMPVNVPNLREDYILGVGDKLSIQIVGERSEISDGLTIERDGSLSIPNLGKVSVSGSSLSEAKKIINNYVQDKTIGNEIFVTLSELRDIQVIVLGGAVNPGVYTIAGGSNILHALNVAGGISDRGSYRKVKILRKDKLIRLMDLYETLIFGRGLFDFDLRSGDTIFIEPVDFAVALSGGVNNPAFYDIKIGETVEDLIRFSGGYSQDHDHFEELRLERDTPNGEEIISLPKDETDTIILRPRDSLVVPMYSKILSTAEKVKLAGMVKRPGTYNIKENETLSQLIRRAGGYKKGAYPYGGVFFRKSAEEASSKFRKRIYSDTINYLVSNIGSSGGNSSQPLTGDFLKILIEESKAQDSVGRIVTEFNLNVLNSNPILDTQLMDQDIINIPPLSQQVYLFGDFNQSLILSYNPEYSVEDYVSYAAGRKSSATKHTIVIDPDGKSHYLSASRFGLFSGNVDIYPGSIIYLPRELGKVDGIQFAAAVAPILSSLTLSLASINAITDD